MKINYGYYRSGNCWRLKPDFRKYWGGKIWHFGFWRFYFQLDFRGNLISELLTDTEKIEFIAANSTLMIALNESLKLQSHYAGLLNMNDGGQRRQFYSAAEWIDRLRECGKIT